jgi:glycosyltransferase involved in cell wall biosynthesis
LPALRHEPLRLNPSQPPNQAQVLPKLQPSDAALTARESHLRAINGLLPGGILFFFHCGSNTGYAIAPLERAFFQVGCRVVGSARDVHFAYPDLHRGPPQTLPAEFSNVLEWDAADDSRQSGARIREYVRRHDIRWAVGFDQPVDRRAFRALRAGGVRRLLAYWGASMSDLNRGWVLCLKRLQVALCRHKPDHFVFESHAMADTATRGRGVSPRAVSVVRLGVDTERFRPAPQRDDYAHRVFGIPPERRIVFYSGHMEERKGVHVLVRAAVELVAKRGRRDVHFLFTGDRPGEAQRFAPLYADTAAAAHISFGGYRGDLPELHRSCYAGAIASVGWDSFTMSAAEMQSSGLPLLVSALQGLVETIEPGVSGELFAPGDHEQLCERLAQLLDDEPRQRAFSRAARERALAHFGAERQLDELARLIQRVAAA